jgi:MFS family permease
MATIAARRGLTSAQLLVLMLGAAVLLNYVDRGAIGVAAPLMKTELGLSATTFGIAVSAFFWVYAPIQLVLGRLCDRFSVYGLLAIGTALWSVSTFCMGMVAGFLSLLLLRLVLGVGESIVFPAGSKIICRHVAPENRGLANAVMATAIALGPAVGTFAGGSILAAFGWRPMFFVFGIASALWLMPWHFLVRALPATERAAEPVVPMRAILRHWSLWAMGIGHSLSNYGFYVLLAFLPLYLVQQRALTIIEMTMLASLGYAVQAIGALSLGAISDRWTRSGRSEATFRRWMLAGGQMLAAGCIAGVFLAPNLIVLALILCLAGVATGALSTNLYAVGQMFAGPRASGTWIGVQNSVGNISGIIGPVVSGILIDKAGYGGAFMLTAAITLAGAFWWVVAVPPIRQIEVD